MNTSSRFFAWALLILSGAGLTACTTVGEKEFACPGRPPGVRCMSATEVYAATHTSDRVAPTAAKPMGDDPRKTGRGRRERHSDSAQPSKGLVPAEPSKEVREIDMLHAGLVPATDKPIPIRTPAQVMRVWFAPWEDSRGALHAGGYAFIEVASRRWTLGENAMTTEPVRFFSIQHNAVDTKEVVGKDRSVSTEHGGTSERVKRTSTLPKETSNETSVQERRR